MLSQTFFSYMDDLIQKGYKKELEIDDYAPLEDQDESQALAQLILKHWDQERQKAKPKLWKVLVKVFWKPFVISGVCFLLETFSKLSQGYFLSLLLNWFRSSGQGNEGYLYTLYLSIAVFCHAILHHLEFFYGMRTGMQMKIALTTAVYQKCLSLSLSHTSSTGLILNLISNDVQRFEDAMPFLNVLWNGPLELVLVAFLLYDQIGLASLAAVGGVIALIPMQSIFASFFKKLRQTTVIFRDDRIKHISDMLSGINVVKVILLM